MTIPEEELLVGSRFRVVRATHVTPRGVRVREIVRHPGAVVLLPILDDGRVCLIRNYRLSLGRTLLELPAGTLEPPEPPAATALRELREETGYRAAELRLLQTFYPSPGVLDEKMYLFLATGLTAGLATPEVGEEMENVLLPWDDALALVLSGEIEDLKTIASLLLADRRRRTEAWPG